MPCKIFSLISQGHIGYNSISRDTTESIHALCEYNCEYNIMLYYDCSLYYAIIYSNLKYKELCQSCLDKLHPELVKDIKFHLIIKKLKG